MVIGFAHQTPSPHCHLGILWFCHEKRPIRMLTGVIHDVLSVNSQSCCFFLGSKKYGLLLDAMISFGMSVSTTAIFYPLARHVWALGSKWLLYIFYPLARHVWALSSEWLFACVDSASRRYIYIFLSACSPCLGPGLRTAILHRNHYSALRPCPLTAIFF